MVDKSELESLVGAFRLLEKFREDPFKILFGTEAKKRICKMYSLNPDGSLALENINYEKKDELMRAIYELCVLDILDIKEMHGVPHYYIKESLMGLYYKQIIKSIAAMEVTVTEVEEMLEERYTRGY